MTEEQIIEMAKQAHVGSKTWVDIYSDQITVGEVRDFLKAFAKLVAQRERLLCSKFLQETLNPLKPEYIDQIEEGIWND